MIKPVFFIDDDEYERRSSTDVLNEVFQGTGIHVEALPPLPTLTDYAGFLAEEKASALILDERLNTTGGVTYTGAELAAHLRKIGGKLPIVILTNFPDDDDVFSRLGWAVEDVVAKKRVLKDPASPMALEFKARLARQIETAGVVLANREQRFHDLLIKSLKESLTPEEEKELGLLEDERILPMQASEISAAKSLQKTIAELKAKLNSDELKM